MGGYVLYLVSSDYQLGGQAFHLKAWRLANLSKSDSIFCWIDPWRLYYKLNLEHNRRGIKKANVFGLGLVAISALVVLVAAGVWYMSAGDNAGRAGEAKKWMGNAIFGLVLALLSWLILYTINPDLVTKPNWVQNLQQIK